MTKIHLKTGLCHEQAIVLSFPQARWEFEFRFREWLYIELRKQLNRHVARAVSDRYSMGIEWLMDARMKYEEDQP
jgi:hypothetical protein